MGIQHLAPLLLFLFEQFCRTPAWVLQKNAKSSQKGNFKSSPTEKTIPNPTQLRMLKTKTWQQIKNDHYGPKGSERRDVLEKDAEVFRVGILIKQARQEKRLTQQQLADLVAKKRSYISRVENDGGNITLKTLVDIVEKGLGGSVELKIHSSK